MKTFAKMVVVIMLLSSRLSAGLPPKPIKQEKPVVISPGTSSTVPTVIINPEVGAKKPTRWEPLDLYGWWAGCPYCRAEGKKSTVHLPATSTVTMLPVDQFYDEQGRFHAHDPNVETATYHCSQGHVWDQKKRFKCPMGDYDGKGAASSSLSLACTNPPCTTTVNQSPPHPIDPEWMGGACTEDRGKTWYLPTDGQPCRTWSWHDVTVPADTARDKLCFPPDTVQYLFAQVGKLCWVYPTTTILTPTPSRPR